MHNQLKRRIEFLEKKKEKKKKIFFFFVNLKFYDLQIVKPP